MRRVRTALIWTSVAAGVPLAIVWLCCWVVRENEDQWVRQHDSGPDPYPIDDQPLLSTDGLRVFFRSSRVPGGILELDLATRDLRLVLGDREQGGTAWPRICRDGSRVIFSRGSDLWLRDLPSGAERSLGDLGSTIHAELSRRAGFLDRHTVYAVVEVRDSFHALVVLPLDRDNAKARTVFESPHWIEYPAASDDGRRIGFTERVGDEHGARGGTTNLLVWDRDTGDARTVYVDQYALYHLTWMPGGRQVCFYEFGPSGYGVVDWASGRLSEPPTWFGRAMQPECSWSADGEWLYYSASSDDFFGITLWRCRRDGTDAEELTHHPRWYHKRFAVAPAAPGARIYGDPDYNPFDKAHHAHLRAYRRRTGRSR